MLEMGGGFCFPAKTFQIRFGGPRAEANHLQRDGPVETFLMGAINNALTATADFLQQFVIAKVSQDLRGSRSFLSVRCGRAIIATGVIRLRRSCGGQAGPVYR